MELVFAPNRVTIDPRKIVDRSYTALFLAGTIDMGDSRDWQDIAAQQLPEFDYIFNPRRPDWDSSWKQTPEDPQFSTQVNWEMDHLESSTHVLFNFEASSKSPITLLELGGRLAALHDSGQIIVVVCPKEFYRYGNVAIACQRESIAVYETLDEGLKKLKELLI